MGSTSFALSILMISTIMLQVTLNSAASTRKPKELPAGQNCTDHLQHIDRCSSMATYSFTSPINPYPQNLQEMRASCDRIIEGLKCLRIYNKCLGSFARRSINAFTGSRSRHSKRMCASMQDPKTVDFWRAGECLRGKKRDVMAGAEKDLISAIQFLSTDKHSFKWEETFNQACCAASVYKNRAVKDIEPECSKFKPAVEDMINSMVGELLDTTCPEENRLKEICSKLPKLVLPKEWKAVSLTTAALQLIVKLSDTKE